MISDRLYHAVDIRMLRHLIKMQVSIDKFRRNIDARFSDQHVAHRYAGKGCQLFADSFCQRCTAHHTVRNIRSDLHTPLHQLAFCQTKLKHAVNSYQCCCRIRASARHAGRYRDKFCQVHIDTLTDIEFIHQNLCRFVYEISVITRKERQIGCQPYARFFSLLYFQLIVHLDRLHYHADFMVTILSFSGHIKTKIYFCKRTQFHRRHHLR